MIPVPNPIPEPAAFETRCRRRGEAWLQANPGSTAFPSYWREFQPDLEDGFVGRCGWLAMRISFGAVDHFFSKSKPEHRHLVYAWSNYRYIAGTINSAKGTHDDALLDPFEIGPGWFEVLLPSCQLVATDSLPAPLRAKAEFTMRQLQLVNGPKVRKLRQRYYEDFKQGKLTLEGLRDYAPLVAEAVERWRREGPDLP